MASGGLATRRGHVLTDDDVERRWVIGRIMCHGEVRASEFEAAFGRRFAAAYAPLDDALARAVVDISGRAYLHYGVEVSRPMVGDFDTDLVLEFFTALTANARLKLHLDLIRGHNAHQQIEASFKAFALALRSAVKVDAGLAEIPSTKGSLSEDEARKSSEDPAG